MRLLFVFTFCILFFRFSFSQVTDAELSGIANRLVQNIDKANKEEIILNTDRKIYVAGEQVYFKAYLFDSIHHYLQTSPQKLFVDIADDKDNVIQQVVLNTSALKTSGSFILPDSLQNGYYWLRAYTRQMAMYHVNDVAVVPVFVINTPFKKDFQQRTNIQATVGKPVVEVFPEGGSVISGLNSTVAVKVTNQERLPLQIAGIVKDNRDSVIARFITNQYGLAKFSYEPVWFLRYKILLQQGNVYDSVAALPRTNFFSGQLAIIKQDQDNITARVALEDSIYSNDFTSYLVAVSGDSICFASVGKGMYNVNIPLTKFPPGVATLYLFDSKEELLSSRFIYVKKENYHLQVLADRQNYTGREKVKLDFSVTDENNNPEMAVINLSVIDKKIADTDLNFSRPDTLQYFTQRDADLIMLAQKQKSNPLNHTVVNSWSKDEDTSFTIKGQIVNKKNIPVSQCVITILANKPAQIVETDTCDNNGKFKFQLPPFYGKILFTYQLSNLEGKKMDNYYALFDTTSGVQFPTPDYLKTTFSLKDFFQPAKFQFSNSDSANLFSDKHVLKPVTVKKSNEDNFDITKRVSRYSHVITREMIGEGPGRAGYALFNVPGIRLMNGYVIVGTPNDPQGVGPKDEPMLVIDGTEMDISPNLSVSEPSPVLSYLNSIPSTTIDSIEVLTGPEAASYGMDGARGVILVTTGAGRSNNLQTLAALKSFVVKGFYRDEVFPTPDYSTWGARHSKSPDERRTIYWNSNIVTDKKGKATVEFYSADAPTTYVGIINGITTNGDKIYKTFILNRN